MGPQTRRLPRPKAGTGGINVFDAEWAVFPYLEEYGEPIWDPELYTVWTPAPAKTAAKADEGQEESTAQGAAEDTGGTLGSISLQPFTLAEVEQFNTSLVCSSLQLAALPPKAWSKAKAKAKAKAMVKAKAPARPSTIRAVSAPSPVHFSLAAVDEELPLLADDSPTLWSEPRRPARAYEPSPTLPSTTS